MINMSRASILSSKPCPPLCSPHCVCRGRLPHLQPTGYFAPTDRNIAGVVDMVFDATLQCTAPRTEARMLVARDVLSDRLLRHVADQHRRLARLPDGSRIAIAQPRCELR